MSEKNTLTIEDRFIAVAESFWQSTDAVRESVSFANEHAQRLDDIPTAMVAVASQRLPNATPEQHQVAANMLLAFMKRGNDREQEVSEKDVDADVEEDRDQTRIDTLNQEIEELNHDLAQIAQDDHALGHYLVAYVRASSRPARLPLIYSALLISAVSNFEVLVAGAIREFLKFKPGALKSEDAKYSLAEIEAFDTLQEFREFCAERYADGILRRSFEDWMAWFQRFLKIGIDEITHQPIVVREIFQRRHLFVHNGGRVSQLYLSKLPELNNPPSLGEQLTIELGYITIAIDALAVAGTLLIALVVRQLVPPEPLKCPMEKYVEEKIYEALFEGRYQMVIDLATSLISDCPEDYLRLVMTVDCWIARKKLHGIETIRTEVEAWQIDSLEPRFRLAKMALQDKNEEAWNFGRSLVQRGDLDETSWSRWPLLIDVRKYGEQLAPTTSDALTVISDGNDVTSMSKMLAVEAPGTEEPTS
jgi:hypothetical protein